MSDRVTIKQLDSMCESINRRLGLPLAPYTRNDDGSFTPNAGVYHIGQQYGGCSLDRMSDTPGCTGISVVFHTTTKRELMAQMRAYLAGLEVAA
jgi:hypothetical protein